MMFVQRSELKNSTLSELFIILLLCITVWLSVADLVTICPDAYSAAANSHALVICTEWDEFAVSNNNNNSNNTLYSSQPEIKAVVQS